MRRTKPYFVAEMSGNHNQSLAKAKEIIDAAVKSKADAVKIQTYTADTITLNCDKSDFLINDPKSLWNGRKLHDLYQEAHTPWEWHKELFEHAKKRNITLFSSPFDKTAIDFLEELGNPIYKIASFEIVDIPLIEYAAKTKKPLIISTGIATLSEISEAIVAAKDAGATDLTILHCVSSYPAPYEEINLKTMNAIKDTFNVKIGLSDHSLGMGVAIAAVAYGASLIEKHFVIDRSEGGVDSAFSMEPHEFKLMIEESEKAYLSLGNIAFRYSSTENKQQRQFARSLYIAEDMKKNDIFTEKNVRSVRPGFGLAPKELKNILGKRVIKDTTKGTPLSLDLVDFKIN
ncbi:MAG: pseudaminic acid synthase [Bacteriovoracaceae bacterium]